MYRNGLKRVFDFCFGLLALIMLSPILLVLEEVRPYGLLLDVGMDFLQGRMLA